MKTDLTPFLTPKQKMFCDAYLTDRNATRAALQAGYSRETALSGYLMTIPKIKLYLEQQMETIAREAQVSHAQLLRELCKIAFGNIGNFFDADGAIKPMNQVSEDDKAALWSVSVSDAGSGGATTSTTKFRMYNKLSALDKIAKHTGFYAEQTDEPKVVYKYVTTADMTQDDTFDDPILQKEIMEWEEKGIEEKHLREWEEKKNQEPRYKNQEVEIVDVDSPEDDLEEESGIKMQEPRHFEIPKNSEDWEESPEDGKTESPEDNLEEELRTGTQEPGDSELIHTKINNGEYSRHFTIPKNTEDFSNLSLRGTKQSRTIQGGYA